MRDMLHKPSFEGEGVKEVRDRLTKPKVQLTLSLEPFVSSFCMMDRLMFVQRVGGRSRMCVSYTWEISPTLIHAPVLLKQKKQKRKTNKCSTNLMFWEPIIIICLFILTFIYFLFYFILYSLFISFLFVHLTPFFLNFLSITQTRLRYSFAKLIQPWLISKINYSHCWWK